MMKRIAVVLSVGLCVAACQKKAEAAYESVAAEVAAAPAADASPPPSGAKESLAPAPVSVPLLAYSYSYQLEAGASRIPGLLKKHEKACVDAGPAVCQVIGSSTRSIGKDEVQASLELRAEPNWLKRFRDGLEGDAKGAGGGLVGAAVESEDLSRAIIDTEAALRAKRALRDRLEGLIASRPGKLQELLEVERELARVQAELDAAESELKVMRTRVATSKLTIEYSSIGVMAPDNAVRPLGEALSGALSNFMRALGALITIVSFTAPFLLVIVPLVWWGLKRRRRKPAKRAASEGG